MFPQLKQYSRVFCFQDNLQPKCKINREYIFYLVLYRTLLRSYVDERRVRRDTIAAHLCVA